MDGDKYRRRRPLISLVVRVQRLFSRKFGRVLGICLLSLPFLGVWMYSKIRAASVVTIKASPIPVARDSPHQCDAVRSGLSQQASADSFFSFPTKKPLILEGFPATPVVTDNTLDPFAHDSVLFRGRASKFPNGPILSTGSAVLFDTSEDEYRLLQVKAYLNYSAIKETEGVESDICVNIMPKDQANSLSSGQEVFCTHEAYYGGDPLPITRRRSDAADDCTHEVYNEAYSGGDPLPITIPFGPHGLRVRPGDKLDIASVSQIFTPEWKTPLSAEELEARDAPPPSEQVEIPGIRKVTTSLDLLALHFEATLVPITKDESHRKPALRSARIPQRDRAEPPWMPTEDAAPLTTYQNTANHPVIIRGLGVFRSMLGHYVAGDTLIKLFVDGREVIRYCPPPHRPSERSAPFDDLLSLNAAVMPGQIVRVEHTLSSYLPDRYKYLVKTGDRADVFWPTSYDLALYVLYDQETHGNGSKDALVPFEEVPVPGGNDKLDLNDDGYPELIDYDSAGTIWTDLTRGGAHDTQHAGIRNLITNKGRFNGTTTTWLWTRNATTKFMEAKVTDKTQGICFQLKAKHQNMWAFHYCDESKVPHRSIVGSDSASIDHCVGDFDGDGHFDRIRLEPETIGYNLNLYFAKGNGKRYLYERLVGSISGRCLGDSRITMTSTYLKSKGRHVAAYRSRCREFNSIDLEGIDLVRKKLRWKKKRADKATENKMKTCKAITPCRGKFTEQKPSAIIHFHIPKAAGSALETNVLEPLAKKRDYRIFHHNDHAESILYDIPEADRTKVDMLTGHQHYGLHGVMRKGAGYITVLRDPVDRVLSLYRYVRGSPTHPRHKKSLDMSLAEFIDWASEETSNWVTLSLCAPRDANVPGYTAEIVEKCKSNETFAVERAKKHLKDDFAVVGLQERYAETVGLIKKCLNVRSNELDEVKATEVYGESKVARGKSNEKPSVEDINAIRAANMMDLQVYDYARNLFHQHCSM